MSIQSALKDARTLLAKSDSPRLDAEILLAYVLEKPREYLYTWPEKELSEEQNHCYRQCCQRRLKGHPIAYLTGQRSFWSFDLQVNSYVLIPRPETELLVELCLQTLGENKNILADLGTGSGAIALALASERPNWTILACDVSEPALDMAKQNYALLGLSNVTFKQGAWCEAFTETLLDSIVSNPPYIDAQDEHLSQGDVRFEPELALISANNGLADIAIIANQSQTKLKNKGWLFLEHGYDQGQAVREILSELNYQTIETHRDLLGHERVTKAQKI